jgi:hypothetical protein
MGRKRKKGAEPAASECGANQMSEGNSDDGRRGHGGVAADDPPRRKVLKACRPSAAQAGAAHDLAQAAAVPAAVPEAAISKGNAAAAAPAGAPAQPLTERLLFAFFNRYFFKIMWVSAKQFAQAMLPFHLARAVPCLHFPPCTQLDYLPLQLQRFLRGCVLATARRLISLPASELCLVRARTLNRWIDCIFVRVMSGFARTNMRAEVLRQGARCACACRAALGRLSCKRSHSLTIISLTHTAANACGYPGTMTGDAGASAALPNVVLLYAHALLVCRLLPPPVLQAKTAFIKRQRQATSLSCKII